MRVASIGECMVELKERPDGTLTRSYGGDTLNTAVYLARLGIAVDYVTALGDDEWSDEMVAVWSAEGVGIGHVHRLPGRLPGLYVIQTDPAGERRFRYWRDRAAARELFDHFDLEALCGVDLIYLSGISLSIYDDAAREMLFAALAQARARGGRVAFDTNFRPRGWPDLASAVDLYDRIIARADIVLASAQDLAQLYGPSGEGRLMRLAAGREIVLKLERPTVRVTLGNHATLVDAPPVARVVDTTAAGDSFAAAYIAARLRGEDVEAAARAGHGLAGLVVGHPGAIIPRAAMDLPATSGRRV